MKEETNREFATFDEAKRSAFIKDLMGFVQRRPVDLLPFEKVKEKLKLKHLVERGIQEVPLNRIIGSLGRDHEFTRAFLPRQESLRKRWEEIKDLAEGPSGFPPVELYYVKDVYFVVDGHHRVSVARAVGASTIEARVKEFRSPVMLMPETSIEEVILKSGLAEFLETTGLVQETPDDYVVTMTNGYEKLLDHISVHRYYRGIETEGPVSWDEAVQSWKKSVYDPMIRIIRKHKILDEFPGHTETDLYLYIMDHLHYLRELYAPKKIGRTRAVKEFVKLKSKNKK
jgi:hypothetical protein